MRVDASQLLATGGIKIKASAGSGTESLRKGDVLRAEIVSKDSNGTLTLKMENGQSFSAKLGTDLRLSVGDALMLEVMEKDNDRISLSFTAVESAEDDLSLAEKNIVREFSDKSLAPYAVKLSELGMPVTERSAQMMRELMALNPKLTLDEAAFLVSNKLTEDPNLMQAALRMLSSGEKTDALIAKLISSMGGSDAANPDAATAQNTQNTAPLTHLLAAIIKNSPSLMEALNHLKQAPSPDVQNIITQGDGNMQTNVSNVGENLSQTGNNSAITTQQGVIQPQQPSGLQDLQVTTLPGSIKGEIPGNSAPAAELPAGDGLARPATPQPATPTAPQPAAETPVGDGLARPASPQPTPQPAAELPAGDGLTRPATPQPTPQPAAETPVGDGLARPATPQPAPQPAAEPPVGDGLARPASPQAHPATVHTPTLHSQLQIPNSDLRSMVAQLLSQVPEFSGTPHAALERFSEMLLRVAGDTVAAAEGETLEAQLEKLFTKIDGGDAHAGTHLRQAREELFARLAMLEETISNSSQSTKAELLSQTHRLMDHVRTLNNIEQFVYMQMPVSQNDQRKSAELYIFKRKGRRQADPDNVNILMAIDLEFMGHWEALLNIKGKDVTLNMEVRGDKEKDHFNENTVLLHRLLDEEGFRLVNTNIKLFEKETTPLTALTAMDRYQGKKQTGIDIRW